MFALPLQISKILFCIVSGPWPKDEGGGERGLRLAENFWNSTFRIFY